MMQHAEMERAIAYWVEQCGYGEVLSALMAVCTYWAVETPATPIEGPSALWAKREAALSLAEWYAKT